LEEGINNMCKNEKGWIRCMTDKYQSSTAVVPNVPSAASAPDGIMYIVTLHYFMQVSVGLEALTLRGLYRAREFRAADSLLERLPQSEERSTLETRVAPPEVVSGRWWRELREGCVRERESELREGVWATLRPNRPVC
jgi:hypothetical protein